ncbi:MAG: HupE/UreJ family protein, partial [Verrucomicrobiota bacterium]
LQAHYLNMTRASVDIQLDQGRGRLDLQVDFTKLIGSPIRYHALTAKEASATLSEQAALSEALLEYLLIEIDGEVQELQLDAFEFPSLPLEKFTEQWAAPMANLSYSFPLGVEAGGLKLRTDIFLKVEFPFVLTIASDQAGARPSTRWLEPGQSSPVYAFAKVDTPSGDTSVDPVIHEEGGVFRFMLRYIRIGFEHILPMGFDHILFILGLFFLSHHWRSLLLQASVFTVAHTITLLFSSLDWIIYDPRIVEPLIALSIVYVGVENVFKDRLRRGRITIVFIFGLIHGMGFANMFSVIDLPTGEFLGALLCFNLGVEFGQITVLAIAFGLLFTFLNKPYYRAFIQIPASALIALIAAYWFLERVGFV